MFLPLHPQPRRQSRFPSAGKLNNFLFVFVKKMFAKMKGFGEAIVEERPTMKMKKYKYTVNFLYLDINVLARHFYNTLLRNIKIQIKISLDGKYFVLCNVARICKNKASQIQN